MFTLGPVTVACMDTKKWHKIFPPALLGPFVFFSKPLCKHAKPIKHCCLHMAAWQRKKAIWSVHILCWVDMNVEQGNCGPRDSFSCKVKLQP